jgi:uncharacterized protein GlcG (DUF336 family)
MADLTLQQATTIIDASLRKGRETGCVPLAVTVPDVGGHLKAFAREDGALASPRPGSPATRARKERR